MTEAPMVSFALSCEPLYLLSEPGHFKINLESASELKEAVTVLVNDSIFDCSAFVTG